MLKDASTGNRTSNLLITKRLLYLLYHCRPHIETRRLTVESAPAGDVAGVVLGEDASGGGDAGQLDGVAQGHMLGELDQGDVVSERDKESSTNQERFWHHNSTGPLSSVPWLYSIKDNVSNS